MFIKKMLLLKCLLTHHLRFIMNNKEEAVFKKYTKSFRNNESLQVRMFNELLTLPSLPYNEERVACFDTHFFVLLASIKSFKKNPQLKFEEYLNKIYSECADNAQRRQFIHLIEPFKQKLLPTVRMTNIDSEQLASSYLHRVITTDGLNLEPSRIIAFNQSDAGNKEVQDAVKIMYQKHKHEGCLITCSSKDIKQFGQASNTLVLVGHGCFHHIGERKENVMVNKDMLTKAQTSTNLFLGPHNGNIKTLVTGIVDDIRNLPKLTHCRILMCRGGSYNLKFNSEANALFQKSADNNTNKSLLAVWDSSQEESLIFDEYSLAYALWHKLFIDPNALFTSDKDFAITAAAGIITPRLTSAAAMPGFFELNDPFHRLDQHSFFSSKYTTQATPSSSKLENAFGKYKKVGLS